MGQMWPYHVAYIWASTKHEKSYYMRTGPCIRYKAAVGLYRKKPALICGVIQYPFYAYVFFTECDSKIGNVSSSLCFEDGRQVMSFYGIYPVFTIMIYITF